MPLWPLVLYFFLVVLVALGMLGISYVLGEHHKEKATDEPYESGVVTTGSARVRFDVKFYLVAMFFVVFDLEIAFLFAWAVAARELGWAGYAAAVVFVAVLVAALVYLWKVGALNWGTNPRMTRKARRGTDPRMNTNGHQ